VQNKSVHSDQNFTLLLKIGMKDYGKMPNRTVIFAYIQLMNRLTERKMEILLCFFHEEVECVNLT